MKLMVRWTFRGIAAVPLVALLFVACKGQFYPYGYPGRTTAQAVLLEEAQNDYDFGPERAQIDTADSSFPGPSVDDTLAPNMTIASMTLKPGRARPPRRLLARLSSDRDYPAMGIYAGVNFVWRDTWDTTAVAAATWRNRVTSSRPGHPDHDLVRDSRLDRFPSTLGLHRPSVLRLRVNSIAFELCLDDPACPSGHCGYF